MLRDRVTLIIKTKKGILLGKHVFNWKYALLGGGVKWRESLEGAVKRELKEETNLECLRMKRLFDFNYRLHRHKVFFVETRGNLKFNWEIRMAIYVNKENYEKFNLNG